MPVVRFEKYALLSPGCVSCLAKSTLTHIVLPTDLGPHGFGTPGGKLCLSLPNARLAIFESDMGQQSFCVFKDSSYVDTGGLFYFANKNTKKSKN